MARRPRKDEERSMDSLMDAMTNVVGILLLILIVSSLGITAAVKKIVENMPEISEEQLQAMKDSRQKTLDNLKELRATQADVEKQVDPEKAAQLALALEEFKKENAELAEQTSDLEELLAKVKELEPIKDEKQERNTEAAKKVNDLDAALAAKPPVEGPPAREITLPDPRPADAESEVYYIACKHQKLYLIGEPYELMMKIRNVLDSSFVDLVYQGDAIGSRVFTVYSTDKNDNGNYLAPTVSYQARSRRAREALDYMNQVTLKTLADPAGKNVFVQLFGASEAAQEAKKEWPVYKCRLDKAKVTAFFKANAGKGELIYTPKFVSDRIRIEVGLNPEMGMTEEQFLSGNSGFVQLIKQAAMARRVAIIFYVAPDSFDTYLKARDFCTAQRVNAGWILWEGEHITDLRPNKRREKTSYDFSTLPEMDYLKLSQFVGPKLVAKVNAAISTFEADLAKVPLPKDLKAGAETEEFKTGLRENREKWANDIVNDVRALYRTPLAASEATRREEVAITIHPPEVMHIRTFVPRNPPNAPRPKPTPGNRPTPSGPPPLILD